jgi:hypothetical protein
MSVDLNKRIDLTCPVCDKGFHQTRGWLVKHKEVVCPHCEAGSGFPLLLIAWRRAEFDDPRRAPILVLGFAV